MSQLFEKKASTRKTLEMCCSSAAEGGERALKPVAFVHALRALGIGTDIADDETLMVVFGTFDMDSDGTVSPDEFIQALRQAEGLAIADEKADALEAAAEARRLR